MKVAELDTINFNCYAKGNSIIRTKDIARLDSMIYLTIRSVNTAPQEPLFLLNLGWMYNAKGDNELSVKIFLKALEFSPTNSYLLLSLGLCSEHNRDYNKAVFYYSEALTSSPFIVESLFFEDLKQRNSLLSSKAIDNAINALKNGRNNYINQSKLSKLYFYTGYIAQSKEILLNITRNLPNLNRSWLTLGDICLKENNFTEAEDCYKKSYILDPDDKLVISRFYTLYDIMKDEEQKSYYKELILSTKTNSFMTNYFKNAYLCASVSQETYPYNLQEYFFP